MKKFLPLIPLMSFLVAHSQQNLFNIPSGDITPANKIFFQQQININSPQQYASKSHFVYGLGKGWEVGFNLVNLYFDFGKKQKVLISTPYNTKEPYPYYPLGLVTAQKGWKMGKKKYWFINIGTQAGTNIAQSIKEKRFTHFSYALTGYNNKKVKVAVGPYLTDWRFVGQGNNAGIIAGTEIHLNNKWSFMADWISGNHKNSVLVPGVIYNVTNNFQLCLGWQIPNPESTETQALVFEINLFNF